MSCCNNCGCGCNNCGCRNINMIRRTIITNPIGTGTLPVTPTFAIGTVTTGAPGSEASASITGTYPNFVLNLTIPQGLTGEQGEQGIQGEVGPQGPAGEDGLTPTLTIGTVTTGAPGSDADASITGTAPDFVLNLTIPGTTA